MDTVYEQFNNIISNVKSLDIPDDIVTHLNDLTTILMTYKEHLNMSQKLHITTFADFTIMIFVDPFFDTLEDAIKNIKKLNNVSFCGYNEWRLPSVREMMFRFDKISQQTIYDEYLTQSSFRGASGLYYPVCKL